jgi:sugar O-acyltransferase (sialic acid O-acetyltransferase NeuD family)
MKNITLIGAGGHAKSCIDVINSTKQFKVKYLVGENKFYNNEIFNLKKIIKADKVNNFIKNFKNLNILIAVGQLKTGVERNKLYQFYKNLGCNFPKIISINSYVSKFSKIKEGSIIMHGAIININSTIGKNCIINSKSLIEHDCVIGDNIHVSTGVIINGGVQVGDNSFIGSGSIIKQNKKIPKNSIIPANTYLK